MSYPAENVYDFERHVYTCRKCGTRRSRLTSVCSFCQWKEKKLKNPELQRPVIKITFGGFYYAAT
jgi:proline racemase